MRSGLFDLDTWQEILETIRRNRLRTALTGFAVAWGIFMLVVLLGSGQGLAQGIEYQFRDDAVNSIWVSGGATSKPYRGLQPGRQISFDNDDYIEVTTRIDGVEYSTGRFWLFGNQQVVYGKETGSFTIRAVHPGHKVLERTKVIQGRYVNELDVRDFRKVAVIGTLVRDSLFGKQPAIGEEIRIKIALLDGVVVNAQPEYEDVAAAAAKLNRPVKAVLAAAAAAAHEAGLTP